MKIIISLAYKVFEHSSQIGTYTLKETHELDGPFLPEKIIGDLVREAAYQIKNEYPNFTKADFIHLKQTVEEEP
jgi:hypothetical protein